MDADEKALLAAIIAHPDEDTPRLIYADWLQEHDQPERAEYIRLSIELANLRYGDATDEQRYWQLRARDPLVDRFYKVWEAEFVSQFPANQTSRFHFRRGFVEGVTCSPTYFLDHAAALFQTTPLRALFPNTLTAATAKRLVNSPYFRRLAVVRCSQTAHALALLSRASVEVCTLDFSTFLLPHVGEWDGVAAAVAGHAGLGTVKVIDFERRGLTDEAGRALADAAHLNFDVLNVINNQLTEAVQQALRERYGSRVWFHEVDRAGTPRGRRF